MKAKKTLKKTTTQAAIAGGYAAYIHKKLLFIVCAFVVLVVAAVVAAATGSMRIPLGTVIKVILSFDKNGIGRIVWDVRLPRILAAILVGAALAMSGTVMQSVLRNPLASPFTLGISNAAAFGASFAIVFLQAGASSASSIIIHNPFVVTICAFAFSLLSALAILLLTKATRISAESMVLAGIAINAICSAGLTLMQYLANSTQLANIVSWSFGDLGRATWPLVRISAIVVCLISVVLYLYRWDFNAMDAGEDTAKSLGVHTERLRVFGMIAASLMAALIVSFFGIIAFIGLLGPHIARQIIGGDHRHVFIASPLIGAIVLLVADTLARSLFSPMVLPVGVLTSLLGGPLFIYLLVRRVKK